MNKEKMNNLDSQLKELYKKILDKPNFKNDRTGVGTKSIFGHSMRFDLREGFPLTTLRKIHIKSLIHELLWFLGSYDEKYKKFQKTNIRYLLDNGVTFWTDWCYKNYKTEKIIKHKEKDLLSIKEFENKIIIDDDFAIKWGDLGDGSYAKQWTDFGGHKKLITQFTSITDNQEIYIKGINQINKLINDILNDPDSRRLIVNTWNVKEVENTLLPPCHILFQCYTETISMEERIKYFENTFNTENIKSYMIKNDISDLNEIKKDPIKQIKILDHFNVPKRYLDLQLYMRSNDLGLGNQYNIASYSLLLTMLGQIVNMIPREFILTIGDAHIYSNHIDAIEEMLKREIKPLPKLKLNSNIQNIQGFRYEDFQILNYDPHPNIKMNVAV